MTRPGAVTRFGLVLASLVALSCKAREGDRCICADDCRNGLVCLAAGRVLADGACSPAVGADVPPGQCVDPNEAGLGEDGFPDPGIYMDLGSKRDFDPSVPPNPDETTSTSTSTSTSTTGEPATTTTGTTGVSSTGATSTGTSGSTSTTTASGGTGTSTGASGG